MTNNNGFLAAVVYSAMKDLHVQADEAVWGISLKLLLLMLRQKAFIESEKPGMQLTLIEKIDSGEI